MSKKRLLVLYSVILFLYIIVECNVFILASNQEIADKVHGQTNTEITVNHARGDIFDRNGNRLTGGKMHYYALSVPERNNYAELFQHVPYEKQNVLYRNRNRITPFFIEVDEDLNDKDIFTCALPDRYPPFVPAQHMIGYIDGAGKGVSGIEEAYDELLKTGGRSTLKCILSAKGDILNEKELIIQKERQHLNGVTLTLDHAIQRACDGIARKNITQGSIVVLQTKSAEILACVSTPRYSPDRIYKSIEANDTSLLNRTLCEFNVGSVFKPVLAAAALEKGWDWYTHQCEGVIQVDDQAFHCAQNQIHGKINLKEALSKSCNCYFIDLGKKLGGSEIINAAKKFGLGQTIYLGGGMKSAAGNLPNEKELNNSGQLANLSFGQGKLTATPLQIAAAMNVVAAGGIYRAPQLVSAVVDEKGNMQITQEENPPKRIISGKTAKSLRYMLNTVVEEGIGKEAMPEYGGAAGKTGTAQTGQYDEDGREKMNYWFAGYYPAENPKYTIVVMQDGIVTPRISSGKIFSQICNAIYWLEKPCKNS